MDVFVGREDELARGDRGGFVLVTGEPGIGKTRLADELARRIAGACVVWGRAWEGEGTPAYWLWLEVMRALGRDARTAPAIAAARDASDELTAWLAGRPLGDARARFKLLDDLTAALHAAAAALPVVIVLDDLHAADTASLEMIAFVAPRLHANLRVIATTRDAAFAVRPELAPLLSKLARDATLVPLRRLTRAEVTRWVEEVAPALGPRAGQLFENSDGNPLFVAELILAWQHDDRARPLAIGDAIHGHLALVSAEARRALDRASVLGRDLARADLVALDVAPAAIDAAVASGILRAEPDDQLRFSHVLVRDELYAALPHATRAELHARAARFGEPEQAVRHVLAAPDAIAPAAALAPLLAAARAASARLAYADAAALVERAVRAFGPRLAPRDEAELVLARGEALIHSGAAEPGRAACLRAAELAREVGDHELFARAALGHALELRLGRHEASVALLREAVGNEVADARLRVQLLSRLGTCMIPALPEEGDEPLRLTRDALAAARALGDDATMFTTIHGMLATFPAMLAIGERYALGNEAIAIAERLGQPGRAAPITGWQIACWLELGNLDAARDELRTAEQQIARLPPHHHWRRDLMRGLFAALDGKFAETAAIARATIPASPGEGATMAAIQLMAMPYLSGDASAYAVDDPLVSRTLGALPGHSLFHSLADVLVGRLDRVRQALAHARSLDLSALPGSSQLGWVVVQAGLAEHAPTFYDLVAAAAVRGPIAFTPNAVMTPGSLDVLAAKLAKLAGRADRIGPHLARARAFATRLGAPALIAQVERAERELGGVPVVPVETPALRLERRGELWAIAGAGREVLLEHRIGLDYLAALVAAPHRDVHVLELVQAEDAGDAGPLLDERAKRAYRERGDALREQLAEAEANADLGRADRARAELEALAEELLRATGLGGRDRRAASTAERARINVQRRLRDVLRRIAEHDARLGRHLELSVKTGRFCRYDPTWP